MRLRQVLLRVWLDRGGEEVDDRAQEKERELAETDRRVKKLEKMVEVKLRVSRDGHTNDDERRDEK